MYKYGADGVLFSAAMDAFEAAVTFVSRGTPAVALSDDQKLRFYALYKQAKEVGGGVLCVRMPPTMPYCSVFACALCAGVLCVCWIAHARSSHVRELASWQGPCTKSAPWAWDVVGRAKWCVPCALSLPPVSPCGTVERCLFSLSQECMVSAQGHASRGRDVGVCGRHGSRRAGVAAVLAHDQLWNA